ncbi:flagellar basal body P-ring formation chaperone FlgA [Sedimenticola hydrogenitrophicus]|uniref:flagellar basal body P-ring formation chaperone FlgA n=1 Tax=Sedimenticola hydrogenitrophicus TaxID=2967975 RepID=UPI0021A86CD3|nr:flagellar basal body P-ring formation chaperone FlgA [Sedimenticola hydrogenitrophicus]
MSRSITTPGRRPIWPLLLLLWPLATLAAGGERSQSHESIRTAAEQHVLNDLDEENQEVSASAGRIDNRLRLSACAQELDTFAPYGRKNSSRITIGVRCNDSDGWTLYVPVTLSIMKEIVVAGRELPRGTILTSADIKTEQRDVARLHRGYLENPRQAVGKKLKRRLHADAILTPGQMVIQHAVKKGNQVVILAQIGTLQVRMNGKALSDGAVGERIKVENNSSNRRIEATVIASGVVKATT